MGIVNLDGRRHMIQLFTRDMASTEPCSSGIPDHRQGIKELTLYEQYTVDHPYTDRNRHDDLLFVPNSDAAGIHEVNCLNQTHSTSRRTCEAQSRVRQRRKPGRRRS